MKILFLGRGDFGFQTLEKLLAAGHEVPLIVTCDHTPEVGGSPEQFKELAEKHGIEYAHTNSINTSEWAERLASHRADLAVALLWLYIIREPVVRSTRLGILNYHAGDLPRYRGNACMNWALLKQEQRIGLTAHLMEPGRLDSGPVVVKDFLSVGESTTIGDVTNQVYARGADLMVRAVEQLADPSFEPLPQDDTDALYCYPRLPRDGEIDWHQPADDICRLIRATGRPYPGAYSYARLPKLADGVAKVTIWSAHAENHSIDFVAEPGHVLKLDDDRRAVVAGDRRLVVLEEIEVNNQPLDVAAAFSSVRIRLGLDLSSEVASLEKQLESLERRLAKLEEPD